MFLATEEAEVSKKRHENFDWDNRERELALRYEQLARYEAFDKLVDMALDGVISLEEAKVAWENEVWVYDDGTEVTG